MESLAGTSLLIEHFPWQDCSEVPIRKCYFWLLLEHKLGQLLHRSCVHKSCEC